ncbi:MAG: DNA-binding response regulator [Chloroflexi bacterium B3_Chlor]|nr:MAG: DNA-binding response regulator [Chloroflexi bacterium B3_Chlor]
MEPIRVLLVDDHILFRKGIANLLAAQADMEVVGEAGDGEEALREARELMPDLILMDITMPGMSGRQATRVIKEEMPYVKIVMLTVSERDSDLFDAIRSGADGYLLKDLEPAELYRLCRGVFRGEAPLSPLMAAKILREFSSLADARTGTVGPAGKLTPREIEVLELIVEGETNKEIADTLYVAESTVKNHLHNILAKLHLKNRVQAAAYAVREGLIDNSGNR